jgi:homoserine dehydrogenase
VAKEVVMQSIANGKHVVTANKALLAVHGTEIFTAAQQKGVMVASKPPWPVASPSSRRCAKA